MNKVSNTHISHRDEKIHPDESRPFLYSPEKPRTDRAAYMDRFKDRKQSPIKKM